MPTGSTTVSGQSGSEWGFVFSVNLNDDGHGTDNLSNVTTTLSLTDVGNGTTGSFNPQFIFDDAAYGAGGFCAPTLFCGQLPAYFAFQNSEALSFTTVASALGDPLYSMNANDTYLFNLTVSDAHGVLSSDNITVVAGRGATVPEPLTLSLFGTGVIGAAIMRRRRKAR